MTRVCLALPLLLALGWLSMGLAGSPPANGHPALDPMTAPADYTVRVSARAGWQQTPLFLKRGDIYWITYDQGTWSIDAIFARYPYVGPEGYAPDLDLDICCPQLCKVDISLPYAHLLGAVGAELDSFPVGRGGRFMARRDGYLALRINDQNACQGDNDGAVQMIVRLETSPTPSPAPSATATLAPSPTATPPPTSTVSPSAVPTSTPTATPSATPTPTLTSTTTSSATPTPTPTSTATLSATPTPTLTSTATPSASMTPTPTATLTLTPSATIPLTPTSTGSPTPTFTPTATPSASPPPLSQHIFLPYLVQGPGGGPLGMERSNDVLLPLAHPPLAR